WRVAYVGRDSLPHRCRGRFQARATSRPENYHSGSGRRVVVFESVQFLCKSSEFVRRGQSFTQFFVQSLVFDRACLKLCISIRGIATAQNTQHTNNHVIPSIEE